MKYVWLFWFCVAMQNTLLSNIAKPPEPRGGILTGQISLPDVFVTGEELTFDFKTFFHKRQCLVNAKYTIDAHGGATDLEFVFVANNVLDSTYQIFLDGKPVKNWTYQDKNIPIAWIPPDSISVGDEKIPYLYRDGLQSFKIDLPEGIHTLEVSYTSYLGEWFERDDKTITSSLVYILRPAEFFESFRNVDITVIKPEFIELTSNAPLTEVSKEKLHVFWEHLLFHHISFSMQVKESNSAVKAGVLIGAMALISLMVLFFWSKWLIKKTRPFKLGKVLIVLNVAAVALALCSGYFFLYIYYAEVLDELFLKGYANPYLHYGRAYVVFLFPIVMMITLAISIALHISLTIRLKRAL